MVPAQLQPAKPDPTVHHRARYRQEETPVSVSASPSLHPLLWDFPLCHSAHAVCVWTIFLISVPLSVPLGGGVVSPVCLLCKVDRNIISLEKEDNPHVTSPTSSDMCKGHKVFLCFFGDGGVVTFFFILHLLRSVTSSDKSMCQS